MTILQNNFFYNLGYPKYCGYNKINKKKITYCDDDVIFVPRAGTNILSYLP